MGRLRRHWLIVQLGEVARSTVFPEDISSRRQFVLIYAIRLLFLVGRRLWRDNMPRQAAALAFQTTLSTVPLLAVALAVLSTIDPDLYSDRLVTALESQLLPEAAHEVGGRLREIIDAVRPRALGLIGGATLVLLAVMLLVNVEQVVNEIFRSTGERSLLRRGVSSVLVLVAAPPAIGFSVYLTQRIVFLPRDLIWLWPSLLTVIGLFVCYYLLPHRKVRVRHTLVAAVFAAVLFELTKVGFALYARHLGVTLSAIYGTFSILPLFLIWVYTAWLIVLFGAQLSAALHEVIDHGSFERRGPPSLTG